MPVNSYACRYQRRRPAKSTPKRGLTNNPRLRQLTTAMPGHVVEAAQARVADPSLRDEDILRLHAVERCLYVYPDDAPANPLAAKLNERGLDSFDDNLAQAFRYFRAAIEVAPEYSQAHNNLGLAYLEVGELNMAKRQFTKAITWDPELSLAYNNRGLVYLEWSRFDKALADFAEAAALCPEDHLPFNNAALLYMELEDYQTALELFATAISQNPQATEAHYNKGLCHQIMGQYLESQACFAAARRIALDQELEAAV